jgi:hypothetical protein
MQNIGKHYLKLFRGEGSMNIVNLLLVFGSVMVCFTILNILYYEYLLFRMERKLEQGWELIEGWRRLALDALDELGSIKKELTNQDGVEEVG